jgi:hypothetical protein
MSWRIERDETGRAVRAWFWSECVTCRDSTTVYVTIEGARVPQPRPCPDCQPQSVLDGIRPRPLEVHRG